MGVFQAAYRISEFAQLLATPRRFQTHLVSRALALGNRVPQREIRLAGMN